MSTNDRRRFMTKVGALTGALLAVSLPEVQQD